MKTKTIIIIGSITAVLGTVALLYFKRPSASIVIHPDGSADAMLGSQTLSTNVNNGNTKGTAVLNTWNGYELDIDFPIGTSGGYSLKSNGSVISASTSISATDTGDTYVTISHN